MINKKTTKVIQKVLYVLSAILAIFAVWAFISSWMYVVDAMKKEQLDLVKNLFAVINYMMGGFMSYLVYAVVLAAIAWIMGMILQHHDEMIETQKVIEEDDEDDEDEDYEDDEDEIEVEVIQVDENVDDEEEIIDMEIAGVVEDVVAATEETVKEDIEEVENNK